MVLRGDGVVGWVHAAALASAPWLASWRPPLVPAVLALAVLVHPPWRRQRGSDPWGALVAGGSCLAAVWAMGSATVALAWALLAGMVAGVAFTLPRTPSRRPDTADLVALVGYGGAFLLVPDLLSPERGGWLAPAVLLVLARRTVPQRSQRGASPAVGPPSREISGRLNAERLVAADANGVPRTAPLDIVLEPGESLAVVCDSTADAESIAWTVAGRRPPASGVLLVDGAPVREGEKLVALVAPGEAFLAGGVDENIAALASAGIPRDTLHGVREACALDEVEIALGGGILDIDGSPLGAFHRLLLSAARVIPSDYRAVVVVDPMPWVNTVRAELWRAAVVRASLGRTALWLTGDRELASRAARMVELRHGSLRTPLRDRRAPHESRQEDRYG